MKKIGMITIGQSPRDDIVPNLLEILGNNYEIIQMGALDDKSMKELESLTLYEDEYILVTRLKDGSEIKINKSYILPLIEAKIKELERQGVSIIVLMCTGKFPAFDSSILVVTPQEILAGVLMGILKNGSLGVIYPAEEQVSMGKTEFNREGIKVHSYWLSPYKNEGSLEELASQLLEANLDLIFLNCFGFQTKAKKYLKEKVGVPVLQSNTLVARVIKELV
jgi:protein AroM